MIGAASNKGVVRVYSPNSQEPLLQILAHNAPVNSIDFSRDGNYMLTAGGDRRFKIFDVRNTYQELYCYNTPWQGSEARFSQTNLAAVSSGSSIYVWKDCHLEKQKAPYFRHDDSLRRPVTACAFVPYEDFMGVAYKGGFESIFVPSSGAREFDTFEDNLNLETKQNREITVQKLLEKVRLSVAKGDDCARSGTHRKS